MTPILPYDHTENRRALRTLAEARSEHREPGNAATEWQAAVDDESRGQSRRYARG